MAEIWGLPVRLEHVERSSKYCVIEGTDENEK